VPAYGSYRQGIVLTIGLHARLLPAEATGARLHDCLAQHYRDSAHVHVRRCRRSFRSASWTRRSTTAATT
jgi:N-acetyl-gamma-glutamylphosphate reductase